MESLDDVALALQRFRIDSGGASYAEIAQRIARRRESLGMTPAAARVARSSVFDVFRLGRTRTNAGLVAEVVLALGGTDADAERWRSRCLRARTTRPADVPELSPATPRAVSPEVIVVLIIACTGLNLFGTATVNRFEIPLFLDMVGTAIAAIALGPWYGAIVGLATNAVGEFADIPNSLAFAPVNIAGALVWGYGARIWRRNPTVVRFLVLSSAVAVVCSLVAVPITAVVLHGDSGHPAGWLIMSIVTLGENMWPTLLSVNLGMSLIDKLLSAVIVLLVLHQFDRRRSRDLQVRVR